MKKGLIYVVAAAVLIATSACSANSTSMDSYSSNTSDFGTAATTTEDACSYEKDEIYYAEEPKPAALASGSSGSGLSDAAIDAYGGHKVIKDYMISFETDDFDTDYAAIVERVTSYGGYVQESYVNGKKPEAYNENGRNANITIRIPAEKALSFINDAKSYGEQTYYNESSSDVTSEYFDRETRLDVLEVQLDRLKNILVETDNLADVLALETEIARVTTEIEELTGELRRYDELIDYSTVTVEITELALSAGPAPSKTVSDRINDGFTQTLYGIGTFFTDLAVFLVAASPVIAILAVIAVVVIIIVKATKRRRHEKAVSYYETPNNPNSQNNPASDNK